MVTKPKELETADENALLDAVRGSAHRIWQAGLGAFAKAQQEGGDLFEKLVQDGGTLQQMLQRLGGEKGPSVAEHLAQLAGNASQQASGSWEKLEKVFEDRVSRALRSLGVPSRQELDALRQDINALARTTAELQATIALARKTIPARKAAAKPATKKAAKPPKAAAKRTAAAKGAGRTAAPRSH